MGNQVMRFLHWIAWARAHAGEVEVINFAFWPFAKFFERWCKHPGCVYPIRAGLPDRLAQWHASSPDWLRACGDARSALPRAVQGMGQWRPGWQAIELDIRAGERLDLEDLDFLRRVRRRRITTCCGWEIASWQLVAEQSSELRRLFLPAAQFKRPADEFIARLRGHHDFLIGVMIRQSDYRVWNGGRFYFSTERYVEWIRQVVALHPDRRVAVVVASEEWQDPAAFQGLPVHMATGNPRSDGHWFEKWVELSLCDVVVSPPSTFSATAAFLGQIPLWPVVAATQVMDPGQVIPDGLVGAARHPVFSEVVK